MGFPTLYDGILDGLVLCRDPQLLCVHGFSVYLGGSFVTLFLFPFHSLSWIFLGPCLGGWGTFENLPDIITLNYFKSLMVLPTSEISANTVVLLLVYPLVEELLEASPWTFLCGSFHFMDQKWLDAWPC